MDQRLSDPRPAPQALPQTGCPQSGRLHVSPLLPDGELPLLVTPADGPLGPEGWRELLPDIGALVEERLRQAGGLLFRGFGIHGDTPFRTFVESFGKPLLDYDFGSTPRSAVDKGVYTSTEYPAHQSIPLHNEQAYTLQWPRTIWFHCVTAAATGGATPIADSREVFRRIDPAVRDRFAAKRLMYVRNYGNGLDLPWQRAFNTDDPAAVERFCRVNAIAWDWTEDGELRTRQICQAVARHPATGEEVWFNQAHLFHVSNLPAAVRDSLLAVVEDETELPRHVFHGDGSPIADADLDHIRAVLDKCTRSFPWQEGDVMMLDNMLAAHGRDPFTGARKVVVAMADPVRSPELPAV
ncbi:TauD/TfdA family dioxygenase [Azospirillum sp. TSH100]|uniref:TauD/TfdA family dioxygenase n=1 Tax=Azospirillum sp. TSH100 TaxID=652764 RepID=UPI000D69893F|nr:TauD/TfdA family dioxygenase [Azospirillum sp. TSH100]QCG91751.1 TauD/TfdA family dioxygenase [Azospirillum sp. TSH100]